MPHSAFESAYGFSRNAVQLSNWRQAPWNVWAFRNVSELVPSARISAGIVKPETPDADPSGLLRESLTIGGDSRSIADFLTTTSTDALVVMKAGRFVADYHAAHFTNASRHIVFSISKSLTAILAGVAEDEGLLDPETPIVDYVPEVAGSAFADASVRHLLDMRVSLAFEEAYLDPTGEFARYRRATLWNPSAPGQDPGTLLGFIASMPKGAGAHGGPFRYRSPNSDLLGLVVERASGERYADYASSRLWQKLGARQDGSVTVDAAGTARAAGGVSMSARDLARVGEMMRRGGDLEGSRIVSQRWVEDTCRSGGSAEAWQQGDFVHLLGQGRYRNKWYQTGYANGAFLAIGIHGQWLYVNPADEVVIVKMSSQPEPVDDATDKLNLQLFEALATRV
ncbi:6-aminohexanoate hydrolase [Labrys okinawensis]|uniref:6-aminohexanoate hydrolase n=1 Tax=Labrys okinawensis TaxID=346911 RepID=A0A2S9QGX3_9HYPH|nr:serine hydrolase [Labrys okinawensis]PRH88594.1 6-aminohexanoate hydrolase [Labrys okinawensis]